VLELNGGNAAAEESVFVEVGLEISARRDYMNDFLTKEKKPLLTQRQSAYR